MLLIAFMLGLPWQEQRLRKQTERDARSAHQQLVMV